MVGHVEGCDGDFYFSVDELVDGRVIARRKLIDALPDQHAEEIGIDELPERFRSHISSASPPSVVV